MPRHFRSRFVVALAIAMLCCWNMAARAATLTTLYSFCADLQKNFCIDGGLPSSRLLRVGTNFYGTTSAGGTTDLGTFFKVSTEGAFKSIFDFCQHCTNGGDPGGYLAAGPGGEIYGSTTEGGTDDGGTVFKISTAGQLTVLHRFCSRANCADGAVPASVVLDKNGNLFGTTVSGGSHGGGTAFEITAQGQFMTLHEFCAAANCTDGVQPGALVLGSDGKFYGTTQAGGGNQSGTVFRMTQAGAITTLYSFCARKGCPDGAEPTGILTEGPDGSFYGETARGGVTQAGVIFNVTHEGQEKTLHSFCRVQYCDDGGTPSGGLTRDKSGGFYGAAASGGHFYNGLIFHVSPSGEYRILYNFCSLRGCFDGAAPSTPPILDTDGYLYGTTSSGGAKFNVGTVYRLKP
jgi:uncharacterized repeat protein (TIGR03803 family)